MSVGKSPVLTGETAMSLHERLVQLTKSQTKPRLGLCCLNPQSHNDSCIDEYTRRVLEVGHPFDEHQVAAAMRSIPEIWRHAKSFPPSGTTSYGYKHELETWWQLHPDRLGPNNTGRLGNGNFIAAMILLGFDWCVYARDKTRARFKLRPVRARGERARSRSPKRDRSRSPRRAYY